MKRVIICMIFVSTQAFGLTKMDGYNIEGFVMPTQTELEAAVNNQKNAIGSQTISINPLLVSDKNEFSVGKVIKHKLKKRLSNLPIFVVGTDTYSIWWAKENAEYLKKIRAVGILTNFESADDLKTFKQQTGLKVVPTSINGLSKIIGTMHYPFLIYNNWVIG